MPYSSQHKNETRVKIVESARILFNRHGFDGVTIDMVMNNAGLTRGGFYNHFKTKDQLYAEAVSSFLMGRGAQWRAQAGIDASNPDSNSAYHMMRSYLSTEHLGDLDGQCPMIALPSDVARAGPDVQASYQKLLEAMISLFESDVRDRDGASREKALTMAALCVGGMVLARTLPASSLAGEVRAAAFSTGKAIIQNNLSQRPR